MNILYVGVDIAQASFDGVAWCKRAPRQVEHYANATAGYHQFGERIETLRKAEGAEAVHLIVEPTAGYQTGLLLFAYRQGWKVTQVNPLQVRRWAQSAGKRAKTDVQDALMLAEYGERMQPPPQEEVAAELQALDLLLRRQQDVKELLQGERNRLFNLQHYPHLPDSVRQSLQRTIEQLEQELSQLEEDIETFLKRHTHLDDEQRLLRSIPGVGANSAPPSPCPLASFPRHYCWQRYGETTGRLSWSRSDALSKRVFRSSPLLHLQEGRQDG
ncbi:MAG: transposase [Caldilinea sp.]|nr:transposase [Caldilinea sp.]